MTTDDEARLTPSDWVREMRIGMLRRLLEDASTRELRLEIWQSMVNEIGQRSPAMIAHLEQCMGIDARGLQ